MSEQAAAYQHLQDTGHDFEDLERICSSPEDIEDLKRIRRLARSFMNFLEPKNIIDCSDFLDKLDKLIGLFDKKSEWDDFIEKNHAQRPDLDDTAEDYKGIEKFASFPAKQEFERTLRHLARRYMNWLEPRHITSLVVLDEIIKRIIEDLKRNLKISPYLNRIKE